MAPSLSVVADHDLKAPPRAETVAERVRRLQAEARDAAGQHIDQMAEALTGLHALATEIHAGGDAYPEGVRALARSIAQDCESRGLTLTQIRGKAK